MWSDSLFSIPEYINEFELKHYCFGEGDSSGGSSSEEDKMPDVHYGPVETPADPSQDDTVGEEDSALPAMSDYAPFNEVELAQALIGKSRADAEYELGNVRQQMYGRPKGFGVGLVGTIMSGLGHLLKASPPAAIASTMLAGIADKKLGTENYVSDLLGFPKPDMEQIHGFELSSEAIPNFLFAELPAAEEATEARNEIASAADSIGFVGDDMPEVPSELIPVAPVSAMRQAPEVKQQIAELLLQPRQGRPGYTYAGEKNPRYFT